MWWTVAKGLLTGALRLLANPLSWIVLLAGTTIVCAYGWRSQIATTQRVTADCEARAEAAVRKNLEMAAEAWATVYAAQQEAVVRMSVAEAQQEANARHWRQKYLAEQKASPACAAWAAEAVQCAVE